jgi:hypothetical protein
MKKKTHGRSLKKILDLPKKEKKLLNIIGYFLLCLVFVNKAMHIATWGDFGEILWFCSYASIFLALGLIFNVPIIVTSVFLTALIAEIGWIIDYCLYLLNMGAGRTAISFAESGWIIKTISVTLHALIIPISGYATFKFGFSKKSIIFSLIVMLYGMLSLTFVLTDAEENRNCMFYDCDMTYEDALASEQNYFDNYLKSIAFWTVTTIAMYFSLLFMFKKLWPERIVR